MVVDSIPTRPTNTKQAPVLIILLYSYFFVVVFLFGTGTGMPDLHGRSVPIRFGIASGPVVAGVVGTRKFFHDVWGDAVNVASRVESTADPGKI